MRHVFRIVVAVGGRNEPGQSCHVDVDSGVALLRINGRMTSSVKVSARFKQMPDGFGWKEIFP